MNIRLASKTDLNKIDKIIESARIFLKSQSIDQWETHYPDRGKMSKDIELGTGFVCETDGNIDAYFSLSFLPDESYNIILGGRWQTDYEYAVLHHFAVAKSQRRSGIAGQIMEFVIKTCTENHIRSIRIDTHKENLPMKGLLKKFKFIKCGKIILSDSGEERDAYEKIVIEFLKDDIYALKKTHPCGSNIFKVTGTGMDITLCCLNCNRQIRLDRKDLRKRIKKRLTSDDIAKLKLNEN